MFQLSPERIIFYRDGVSEGQFTQIFHEIEAVKKACKNQLRKIICQVSLLLWCKKGIIPVSLLLILKIQVHLIEVVIFFQALWWIETYAILVGLTSTFVVMLGSMYINFPGTSRPHSLPCFV